VAARAYPADNIAQARISNRIELYLSATGWEPGPPSRGRDSNPRDGAGPAVEARV